MQGVTIFIIAYMTLTYKHILLIALIMMFIIYNHDDYYMNMRLHKKCHEHLHLLSP